MVIGFTSAISVAYHEENTKGEEICKAIELKLKNYKVHNELVMIWKKNLLVCCY
jgi:hypothetical protein